MYQSQQAPGFCASCFQEHIQYADAPYFVPDHRSLPPWLRLPSMVSPVNWPAEASGRHPAACDKVHLETTIPLRHPIQDQASDDQLNSTVLLARVSGTSIWTGVSEHPALFDNCYHSHWHA